MIGRMRPSAWRLGLAAGLLALVGCDQVMSQTVNVCVSAYNQRERAIHGFWLDDENKAGCWGNISGRKPGQLYGGGGKHTCGCSVTPGETVALDWEYGRSMDELKANIPREAHSTRITIPEPQSSDSRYLRLYFLEDGETMIDLVDDFGPPIPPPDQGAVNDEHIEH